jgi:hypothetical protein
LCPNVGWGPGPELRQVFSDVVLTSAQVGEQNNVIISARHALSKQGVRDVRVSSWPSAIAVLTPAQEGRETMMQGDESRSLVSTSAILAGGCETAMLSPIDE